MKIIDIFSQVSISIIIFFKILVEAKAKRKPSPKPNELFRVLQRMGKESVRRSKKNNDANTNLRENINDLQSEDATADNNSNSAIGGEKPEEIAGTNKVIGGSPIGGQSGRDECLLDQKDQLLGQPINVKAMVHFAPPQPNTQEDGFNNLGKTKHDLDKWQADVRLQERKRSEELIMNMITVEQTGELTTPANTGSNKTNAMEMQQMSPTFHPTPDLRSRQLEEAVATHSAQNQATFESRRDFQKFKQSIDNNRQSSSPSQALGMSHQSWALMARALKQPVKEEPQMKIWVTREAEKPSYPLSVAVGPFMAMNIKEGKQEDFLRVILQNDSLVWSAQNTKEQLAIFNKVCDSSPVGKRHQKDELQSITEERMKCYDKQMVTIPSETKSAIPSSTHLFTKLPKQDTDLNHQLPRDMSTLRQLGPHYSEPMIEIMQDLNPCMKLTIGANIFTCPQKAHDNLCYAFAGMTALTSMESIRYAASIADGFIGDAVTKFMQSSNEDEKYEIVKRLAEKMPKTNQTIEQEGEDASVFAEYLLNGLASEGLVSPNVFSQHIETWSTCVSCGGERKSESHVYMSVKNNHTPSEDLNECTREENCRDGEYYQTDLLNCPDAVFKVVSSRKKLETYNQREEVPYSIEGRGGSPYQLKFVTVHLGDTPDAGHFVTAISNSADRDDCVLVDNGKVLRIKREQFDKFTKSAFLVGYELVEAETKCKPSQETIMNVTQQTLRKLDAREKLAALIRFETEMPRCLTVIDKSYKEKESKKKLTDMLKKNLCSDEGVTLLKEELATNCKAKLLINHIENYTRNPQGYIRRGKLFFGLSNDNQEIQRIERLSQSRVFGTGARLVDHAKQCASPNRDEEFVCEHCETTGVGTIFQCNHCQATLCKKDMLIHIQTSRCAANRMINEAFWHTPRKHGRGMWTNNKMRLSVIRPHSSGNKTQYILEEADRAPLNWVVRTCSPTQLAAEYDNQKGRETVDGTMWLGEGYAKDDKHVVAAKEEILYKDVDAIQGSKNVPVWSLLSKIYSVREAPEQVGEVNLNIDGHPAKNPKNLVLEHELELIQVASEEGKNFRMVVRRNGKQDEELTFVRHFEGNEVKPDVDDGILHRMDKWHVSMRNYVTKHHLEFEQFFQEVIKSNAPYRFLNNGNNLCWINTTTQIFLSILPNIARDLSAVMKQDSTLSGQRDLVKLLVQIIANCHRSQSLNNLRSLVSPGMEGKPGPALQFLEDMVAMLNKQAPQAVNGLSSEKTSSISRKSCEIEGCNGTFEPSFRSFKKQILQFMHNEEIDGRSAQNCIDRKLKESTGPFLRTCTNGHQKEVHSVVSWPKRPEVFLVPAYQGNLDQESSMEVEFLGSTYKAFQIIHHQRGEIGHHFCSLFDAKTGVWSRIDDYRENYKLPYVETEKTFKIGSEKLFDDLGVVCYKLKERDTDQEPDIDIEAEENMEPEVDVEPEANNIDSRVNFHTATDSGQQVFLAKNTGNKCYVNSSMAALLGNPHIHQIFRNCADGADATDIEKYLQKLCHCATGHIFQDIEEWKQKIVLLSTRNFNDLENFKYDNQQDVMEFLQYFIQSLCDIEDTVNHEGEVVEQAPMSTQNRELLRNVLGHTTVTTTICMERGCGKRNKETKNGLVLSLDVNDVSKKSVNDCLKAHFQLKDPYNALLCETCSTSGAQYRQQESVSNLKKCAILQLKRFQDQDNKENRSVIVDEVLQEGPYAGYLLTGAILHQGASMKKGHYTHILRDVESGKWFKTSDHISEPLSDEVARDQLKRMGYILFYSSPDQFPPPLKAQKATKSTTRSRKEPTQRKSYSAKTTTQSTFKTCDGPPNVKVTIPTMPAQSNWIQSEVRTPTEQEIAEKIKKNSKSTHQQIIDPNDALAVTLKAKFGHDDFRSREQMEATKAIIDDKGGDVMVVMSTGEICSLKSIFNILLQEVENLSPTSWQL